MVWKTGVVPRDWRRAATEPIHKKEAGNCVKTTEGSAC